MREHITINLNISSSAVLTESSKSPAEQLFGVELRSKAVCEYPPDFLQDMISKIYYRYEKISG